MREFTGTRKTLRHDDDGDADADDAADDDDDNYDSIANINGSKAKTHIHPHLKCVRRNEVKEQLNLPLTCELCIRRNIVFTTRCRFTTP